IIGSARRGYFEDPRRPDFPYTPKIATSVFLLRKTAPIFFSRTGDMGVSKLTVVVILGLLSTAAESIRSIEAIPQASPLGVIDGGRAAETNVIYVLLQAEDGIRDRRNKRDRRNRWRRLLKPVRVVTLSM